jgi:hypothetical protein
LLDAGRSGELLADWPQRLGADYFETEWLAEARVAALGT